MLKHILTFITGRLRQVNSTHYRALICCKFFFSYFILKKISQFLLEAPKGVTSLATIAKAMSVGVGLIGGGGGGSGVARCVGIVSRASSILLRGSPWISARPSTRRQEIPGISCTSSTPSSMKQQWPATSWASSTTSTTTKQQSSATSWTSSTTFSTIRLTMQGPSDTRFWLLLPLWMRMLLCGALTKCVSNIYQRGCWMSVIFIKGAVL